MAGDSALVSLQGRDGWWTRAAESCWLAEAPGVPLGRPEACLPPCPPRERLSALSPCSAHCTLWRPGPLLTRPAAPSQPAAGSVFMRRVYNIRYPASRATSEQP